MALKVKLPPYLTYEQLKQLMHWPYGRAQTDRLMYDEIYVGRRFPAPHRFGGTRSLRLWRTSEVVDYYKRHGLPVPEDDEFS